jgi:hypothetical protein
VKIFDLHNLALVEKPSPLGAAPHHAGQGRAGEPSSSVAEAALQTSGMRASTSGSTKAL